MVLANDRQLATATRFTLLGRSDGGWSAIGFTDAGGGTIFIDMATHEVLFSMPPEITVTEANAPIIFEAFLRGKVRGIKDGREELRAQFRQLLGA